MGGGHAACVLLSTIRSMTDFTISNRSTDDEEPNGEHDWRFRKFNSDETMVVPGDNRDEAWKALHYHVGDDWLAWELLGYDDLVADDYYDREVSLAFARRNPYLVDKWRNHA